MQFPHKFNERMFNAPFIVEHNVEDEIICDIQDLGVLGRTATDEIACEVDESSAIQSITPYSDNDTIEVTIADISSPVSASVLAADTLAINLVDAAIADAINVQADDSLWLLLSAVTSTDVQLSSADSVKIILDTLMGDRTLSVDDAILCVTFDLGERDGQFNKEDSLNLSITEQASLSISLTMSDNLILSALAHSSYHAALNYYDTVSISDVENLTIYVSSLANDNLLLFCISESSTGLYKIDLCILLSGSTLSSSILSDSILSKSILDNIPCG